MHWMPLFRHCRRLDQKGSIDGAHSACRRSQVATLLWVTAPSLRRSAALSSGAALAPSLPCQEPEAGSARLPLGLLSQAGLRLGLSPPARPFLGHVCDPLGNQGRGPGLCYAGTTVLKPFPPFLLPPLSSPASPSCLFVSLLQLRFFRRNLAPHPKAHPLP